MRGGPSGSCVPTNWRASARQHFCRCSSGKFWARLSTPAKLQKKTGLATEAMIGVAFAGSLGVGATLTPQEDLVEALFGRFQTLSFPFFLLGVAAVLLIAFIILRYKEQLLLSLFSPDLAAATSVRLNKLNIYFLLTFSLTVLVGLRFTGALLAGALIIVPATTARRLTDNVSQFLVASCCISVAATGIGFLITRFALPRFSPGPIVVIVSASLFALSLFRKTT